MYHTKYIIFIAAINDLNSQAFKENINSNKFDASILMDL